MAYGSLAHFSNLENYPIPAQSPVISSLVLGKKKEVKAGIGDLRVSGSLDAVLATYSLGSCIGVSAYDPVARIGGLLHFQLPHSSISPEKAQARPYMFADTGIPALFEACSQLGAKWRRMEVKIAGGASSKTSTGVFNIGPRNYQALTDIFKSMGKSINAQETGGFCSRSMWLDMATGEVTLKTNTAGQHVAWTTM
ncbi:chemotaxis protein CheD [Desulfatibacillum aliphaticivorans]|uniref:Probable chemoreceptor glutamine deamidase CheD n=1 Tax=Desulfatibacillum aliphaticivorans TaxID=218208 RepID=B8FMB0_DESAL|nr:chemotaxis protein CheD [Desulfatibacillum aliphaticivorans]ACL05948.1 Chemotaxis protein, CheD [Desulfatibacillum aliphaticivorans]